MGNVTLYEASLRKFCTQQADMPATCRNALTAKDNTTAKRVAHTLKGVAASIGAEILSVEAANLEIAITNQLPVSKLNPLIAKIEVHLKTLIAAIQQHLPPLASPPAADKATAKAAVAELDKLLADSNPEAMAWLDQHSQVLATAMPADRAAEIETLVRAFELDQALQLLRLV